MSIVDEAELEPLTNLYPPNPRQQYVKFEANLRKLAGVVERRTNALRQTLDEAREVFLALKGRVDTLEQTTVTITVVAAVADLPANAPPRQWFRVTTGTVPERAAIYVGNGPSLPLTKLTPSAL